MFPFDDVIMFTDEVYKNRIKDSDTYPHISNIRRTLVYQDHTPDMGDTGRLELTINSYSNNFEDAFICTA